MKKLTVLLLFFSLAAAAQVFPELDPFLLKPGMKLKPNNTIKYGFKCFYSDSTAHERYKQLKDKRITPPEELKNRTFEVLSVKKLEKVAIDESYSVKLRDVDNQEILYYSDDIRKNICYEVVMIDTIDFSPDYFCEYVESSTSQYTFILFSGILKLEKMYRGKNKYDYNIVVKTQPVKRVGDTGTVILNLKNDKKIIKKGVFAFEKDSNSRGEIVYESPVPLTEADLLLIKENEIVSYDFFGVAVYELRQQDTGIISGAIDCFLKR